MKPLLAANDYNREIVTVLKEGNHEQPIATFIYIANKENTPGMTSKSYKQYLLNGANHWGLPKAYIVQLEQINTIEE